MCLRGGLDNIISLDLFRVFILRIIRLEEIASHSENTIEIIVTVEINAPTLEIEFHKVYASG